MTCDCIFYFDQILGRSVSHSSPIRIGHRLAATDDIGWWVGRPDLRLFSVLAVLLVLAVTNVAAEGLEYCRKAEKELATGNYGVALGHISLCISEGKLTTTQLAAAHNNRGYANIQIGKYDEAIRDSTAAINAAG